MTEFLIRKVTEGRHPEWMPESYSSLEAVLQQIEDWADPKTSSREEMANVLQTECVDGAFIIVGSLDITHEIKERLKQRDMVRMEKEYAASGSDFGLEAYCELNARF